MSEIIYAESQLFVFKEKSSIIINKKNTKILWEKGYKTKNIQLLTYKFWLTNWLT